MTKLLVQIALQLVFTTSFVFARTNTTALGEGFFIATKDILGEFVHGAAIFDSLPTSCSKLVLKPETKQVSSFFKTTASFYEYVSTKVGLSASVKGSYTLGTTLEITSQSISGSSLETSGISLDVYALKDATVLSQNCQNDQPLSKAFLAGFQELPVQIKDPNSKADWIPYDSFLKKYGSHLVNEINHGTRLQQWVFASRSEEYTQRDFNVRACVDLSRNTGDLKLESCGNYSKQEKNEVLKLSMSNMLHVKGGTAKTRAQLRKERTAELIEKFLLEAQDSPGNVLYKWTAVWDLLKQRSIGASGDNLARAMNLEAYYKGVLGFGCTKVITNGVLLRWLQQVGDEKQPEYSCQIAPEGCRDGNRDCHLGGSGSSCYCYGPTCVDTKQVNNPNSKIKEERVIRSSKKGSYKSGINNSCHYKFIAHCNCNRNWGGNPTTIWPDASEIESRRLLLSLHAKIQQQKKSSQSGSASSYRGITYYLQALLLAAIFLVMY